MEYKIHIKRTDGRKVCVDPEYRDSIYLYPGEVKKLKLADGMRMSSEEFEQIRIHYVMPRAKKRALGILVKRDRTEQQLRDQLKKNQYDEMSVEEALDFVRAHHYVDDEQYARDYLRSKKGRKSYKQIRMELTKKGISRDVLDALYEGTESQSLEDLLPLAEKYVRRFSEIDREARNKTYLHFARKGYPGDLIQEALECIVSALE